MESSSYPLEDTTVAPRRPPQNKFVNQILATYEAKRSELTSQRRARFQRERAFERRALTSKLWSQYLALHEDDTPIELGKGALGRAMLELAAIEKQGEVLIDPSDGEGGRPIRQTSLQRMMRRRRAVEDAISSSKIYDDAVMKARFGEGAGETATNHDDDNDEDEGGLGRTGKYLPSELECRRRFLRRHGFEGDIGNLRPREFTITIDPLIVEDSDTPRSDDGPSPHTRRKPISESRLRSLRALREDTIHTLRSVRAAHEAAMSPKGFVLNLGANHIGSSSLRPPRDSSEEAHLEAWEASIEDIIRSHDSPYDHSVVDRYTHQARAARDKFLDTLSLSPKQMEMLGPVSPFERPVTEQEARGKLRNRFERGVRPERMLMQSRGVKKPLQTTRKIGFGSALTVSRDPFKPLALQATQTPSPKSASSEPESGLGSTIFKPQPRKNSSLSMAQRAATTESQSRDPQGMLNKARDRNSRSQSTSTTGQARIHVSSLNVAISGVTNEQVPQVVSPSSTSTTFQRMGDPATALPSQERISQTAVPSVETPPLKRPLQPIIAGSTLTSQLSTFSATQSSEFGELPALATPEQPENCEEPQDAVRLESLPQPIRGEEAEEEEEGVVPINDGSQLDNLSYSNTMSTAKSDMKKTVTSLYVSSVGSLDLQITSMAKDPKQSPSHIEAVLKPPEQTSTSLALTRVRRERLARTLEFAAPLAVRSKAKIAKLASTAAHLTSTTNPDRPGHQLHESLTELDGLGVTYLLDDTSVKSADLDSIASSDREPHYRSATHEFSKSAFQRSSHEHLRALPSSSAKTSASSSVFRRVDESVTGGRAAVTKKQLEHPLFAKVREDLDGRAHSARRVILAPRVHYQIIRPVTVARLSSPIRIVSSSSKDDSQRTSEADCQGESKSTTSESIRTGLRAPSQRDKESHTADAIKPGCEPLVKSQLVEHRPDSGTIEGEGTRSPSLPKGPDASETTFSQPCAVTEEPTDRASEHVPKTHHVTFSSPAFIPYTSRPLTRRKGQGASTSIAETFVRQQTADSVHRSSGAWIQAGAPDASIVLGQNLNKRHEPSVDVCKDASVSALPERSHPSEQSLAEPHRSPEVPHQRKYFSTTYGVTPRDWVDLVEELSTRQDTVLVPNESSEHLWSPSPVMQGLRALSSRSSMKATDGHLLNAGKEAEADSLNVRQELGDRPVRTTDTIVSTAQERLKDSSVACSPQLRDALRAPPAPPPLRLKSASATLFGGLESARELDSRPPIEIQKSAMELDGALSLLEWSQASKRLHQNKRLELLGLSNQNLGDDGRPKTGFGSQVLPKPSSLSCGTASGDGFDPTKTKTAGNRRPQTPASVLRAYEATESHIVRSHFNEMERQRKHHIRETFTPADTRRPQTSPSRLHAQVRPDTVRCRRQTRDGGKPQHHSGADSGARIQADQIRSFNDLIAGIEAVAGRPL